MGLKHNVFCIIIISRHTYFFFNFRVGGTLLSLDLGPKGGSNFKALWRSHLTSVRGPISYRIRFMTRRSFFFFYYFFQFLSGGTLFSWDLGPKVGPNFKALWRSHLISVRAPISYRIRFMTPRSFFFPLKGGGQALSEKFHYFFF